MTATESVAIGKVSAYLASLDIANGALYGERLDNFLPILLSMETDILDWQNQFDSSDITLPKGANYLYSLCAPYNLQAQSIIDGNNGGSIPSVITPYSGLYPFVITFTVGDINSPANNSNVYQSNDLIGALLLAEITVRNTTETIVGGDFTFDSSTGTITRTNSWFTGDTAVIKFFKTV